MWFLTVLLGLTLISEKRIEFWLELASNTTKKIYNVLDSMHMMIENVT